MKELCSQVDVLLCHLMQRLIDLSGGIVLEEDATFRRKRKYKGRLEEGLRCIPLV